VYTNIGQVLRIESVRKMYTDIGRVVAEAVRTSWLEQFS